MSDLKAPSRTCQAIKQQLKRFNTKNTLNKLTKSFKNVLIVSVNYTERTQVFPTSICRYRDGFTVSSVYPFCPQEH